MATAELEHQMCSALPQMIVEALLIQNTPPQQQVHSQDVRDLNLQNLATSSIYDKDNRRE